MESSERPVMPEYEPKPPLPPVEAPNAGFLLQLFLVPLLIVGLVVLVWLMISGLAHWNTSPHDLARDLRTLNDASWQKAYTLSNLLRDPQHKGLRSDQELADELVGVLAAELETGGREPPRIQLRNYLCRTLGEFELPSVAPVLARAATQERHTSDVDVRLSAVEALAVLAGNAPDESLRTPEVLDALLAASEERSSADGARRDDLRSAAAFALGAVGGEQAEDRLATMLGDSFVNARYNAATGLARHADSRCVEVLCQMLDESNAEAVADEPSESAKQAKRIAVIEGGLLAVRRFVQVRAADPEATNPATDPDLTRLAESLRKLESDSKQTAIRFAATETLALFEE